MRIEIPLRAWARGQGLNEGKFLQGPGPQRCVLGFIFAACGVPDDVLMDHGSISALPVDVVTECVPSPFYRLSMRNLFAEHPTFDHIVPSDVTQDVTTVNDDEFMDDDERQYMLRILLEPHGFDLHFIEAPYADEQCVAGELSPMAAHGAGEHVVLDEQSACV